VPVFFAGAEPMGVDNRATRKTAPHCAWASTIRQADLREPAFDGGAPARVATKAERGAGSAAAAPRSGAALDPSTA